MPVERDDLHKSIQAFFDLEEFHKKYIGCLLASQNDESFLAKIEAVNIRSPEIKFIMIDGVNSRPAKIQFILGNIEIGRNYNYPDHPGLHHNLNHPWEMDGFVDRKVFIALQPNEWKKVEIFLTDAFDLIMKYTDICKSSLSSPATLIILNQDSSLSASQVIQRNAIISKMKELIAKWEEAFPGDDQTPDILKMSDTARPFTKSLCATVEFLKNAIKEDWR